MPIGTDFSVAANGDIRYTGATDNYTVIEFHRWLGDLMDDAQAAGNDVLDITDATASERSTDNIITLNSPFNIDDTAAQHLYDGSVIQSGGATIYDGIVTFANAGAYLEVVQNGALVTPNFWTTGLNADAANGISHRFMVKVRSGGADIDGRRLIGQTREFGFTYSEFKINGTARGNNVFALTYATDLNNQTAAATVATWTTITNTEGYRGLDVDNDTVNEFYYSEWNRDTFTINQFYERMKWLTRRGSASTIYGLNGELFRGITHELDVDTPSGTFNAVEEVTWSGGSGQMLAINSPTAATKMWIQLKTGAVPTDGQLITGTTSMATVEKSPAAVVERTLSFPFVGVSTGSALIGAYGLGIEPSDLSASDKLFDLTNTQRTPPNNVVFSVLGLVSGEDRVLVGPESGGGLQLNQLTLNTTLSGANETEVVVTTTIPSDTPSPTGTIRIELNSGIYRRVPYNSFSGSTFFINGTDFQADPATAPKNVFISYIDTLAGGTSESFTVVFASSRSLFVRVRDGASTPIKTFETTATLGAGGGSATAIRTSDA
jgi:hypothetical protein